MAVLVARDLLEIHFLRTICVFSVEVTPCLCDCRRRPLASSSDGSGEMTAVHGGARALHLAHHGREVRCVVLVPAPVDCQPAVGT